MSPPDWPFLLLALAACSAAAFTPGPNNTICMSTAVNFGFWRAVPFCFGVCVGFPVLVLAAGLGVGGVFSQFPQLQWAVKIAGALFLLHMAWKIARAREMEGAKSGAAPGFARAVAFQWINPKALTYALSVVAAFVRPGDGWMSDLAYLTLISMLVSFGSTATWAAFGAGIRRALKTPRALAVFNTTMGALLALSAAGILLV